jgi:hypothetical protein
MFQIPKGLYVNVSFLHTIPSGFGNAALLFFYKHIFPSGMYDSLKLRYKTDNCNLFNKNTEGSLF